METRANFALMGALVIISVLALAGFTLWLGQSQFNRDFDTYEIVFEGPVTLETGSAVRFNGISVGEVTRVAIDRGNDRLVRTRVRVNSDTPVRMDSVAEIDFAGITGLTYVQIRAGSPSAALLERIPGEPLPVIRSELNPLAEIFVGGANLLETANASLESIGSLLSEENVAAVSSTLGNLDEFTGSIAGEDALISSLVETLNSVQQASDDFAEASRAITQLSETANGQIETVVGDAGSLITDLRATVRNIDEVLETANGAAGSATMAIEGPATEALEEVRLVSQDLRTLIQRFDSIARELEQNPQSIVLGDPKPYEGGER